MTGNGQYTQTFGYDLTGNIITRTASAMQWYTYNVPPAPSAPPSMPYKAYLTLVMRVGESYGSPPPATLHQPFAVISTTAGFRAAYDPNGNMALRVEMSNTQPITYTQAWDVENRLTVVTNTVSGEVTRFAYNADGARVLQFLPDGSRTVYVGPLEVSITGTQHITKTYYTVGAQMVALRVISSTGNVLYYMHGDHLGSVSLVTSAAGAVVAQQLYAPFGVPRWISGTLPTDVGFTSQRADSTGLMFYNARYYSHYLARFISADTVVPEAGNPQALNRYTYVANNPLKLVDPSGHCWGIASGIRGVLWYGDTCYNMDLALTIVQSPKTSLGEKAFAGWYAGTEATMHVVVVAGTVYVLWEGVLVPLGWQVAEFVVAHPLLAKILGVGGTAVTKELADGDDNEAQVAQALSQQANNIRQALGVGKGRNIAIGTYEIGGASGEVVGVSGQAVRAGTVDLPADRLFTTNLDKYPRDFDAEVKVLEDIARQFAKTPNVSGTLRLFSERPFCDSCVEVINQFMKMFPNIKVILISGNTPQ